MLQRVLSYDLPRAVTRPAVHHNDFSVPATLRNVGENLIQRVCDACALVVRWQDDAISECGQLVFLSAVLEAPSVDASPMWKLLLNGFQSSRHRDWALYSPIFASSSLMTFPVGVTGMAETINNCDGRLYGARCLAAYSANSGTVTDEPGIS